MVFDQILITQFKPDSNRGVHNAGCLLYRKAPAPGFFRNPGQQFGAGQLLPRAATDARWFIRSEREHFNIRFAHAIRRMSDCVARL